MSNHDIDDDISILAIRNGCNFTIQTSPLCDLAHNLDNCFYYKLV